MHLMLFVLIFCSSMLYASIGTITTLEGKATIKRGEESLIVLLGNEIEKKDIISTQENSKVKITLNDNTIISIGKESTLNIEEYVYDTTNPSDSKTELNFVKGAFHTITGQIGKINPSKFKLKTKSASIGIRGTEIYGDETKIACTKGTIEVTSFGITHIVSAGNFVDTFIDKAPSTPKKLDNNTLNKIKNTLQSSNNNELNAAALTEDKENDNDETIQYNDNNLEQLKNDVSDSSKNQTVETPAAETPNAETPAAETPAVATIATLSILEGTSLQTGSLPTISNTNSSILTYSTNTTIAGFSLDSDGTYSFDATNSAYDNLNRGESQTLTIPITAIDDTGLSTTSNLKIVVEGNSDLSGYQLAALINTDINKTTQVNNSTLLGPSKMNVYTDKVILGEYNRKDFPDACIGWSQV